MVQRDRIALAVLVLFFSVLCSPNNLGAAYAAPQLRPQPLHCAWVRQSVVQAPSAQYSGSAGSSSSDVWVVGAQQNNAQTLTEHFDGSAWSIVPSPNAPGSAVNFLQSAAAFGPADVWAVGSWSMAGPSEPETLTEHFDGKAWSIVPSVNPEAGNILQAVTIVNHDDVWAVGDGCTNGVGCRPLMEHFNGTRWYLHYAPSIGFFPMLRAVSADGPDDIWAVGETQMSDGRHHERSVTLAMHWDGSTWSWVHTPNPDQTNRFWSVKAFGPTDVWAAGWAGSQTRYGHAFVEHWNGSSWSVIAQPAQTGPSSLIYSLAGSASDDLWAFGLAFSRGSILAEHWDGAAWAKVAVPPRDSSAYFKTSFVDAPDDVWAFGVDNNQPLGEHFSCTSR